jgi:hypothetical protein
MDILTVKETWVRKQRVFDELLIDLLTEQVYVFMIKRMTIQQRSKYIY